MIEQPACGDHVAIAKHRRENSRKAEVFGRRPRPSPYERPGVRVVTIVINAVSFITQLLRAG